MKKPCSGCINSFKFKTLKIYKFEPDMRKPDCIDCEKYKKYLEWRKSKQKYYKGERINNMGEYANYTKHNNFVYWRDAIRHRGFMNSMQYRIIEMCVEGGYIFKAHLKEDGDCK